MKHLLLALVMAAAAGQAHAQFPDKPSLGYAAARSMATACEDLAIKSGWKTTIAILDEGGRLVYFSRMDGADFNHGDMAINKAMMALRDGRPSSITVDRVNAGEYNLLSLPGYVAAGGGYPVFVRGMKIGALGISGRANFVQTRACAKAAFDAVGVTLPPENVRQPGPPPGPGAPIVPPVPPSLPSAPGR
jgi:uncharacterized protein GlcG (DUF336 family)